MQVLFLLTLCWYSLDLFKFCSCSHCTGTVWICASFVPVHTEGDIGVCGGAVLLSYLLGIPVSKIPHCGVGVISNPTVRDVCVSKPTVFGKTKLSAVL